MRRSPHQKRGPCPVFRLSLPLFALCLKDSARSAVSTRWPRRSDPGGQGGVVCSSRTTRLPLRGTVGLEFKGVSGCCVLPKHTCGTVLLWHRRKQKKFTGSWALQSVMRIIAGTDGSRGTCSAVSRVPLSREAAGSGAQVRSWEADTATGRTREQMPDGDSRTADGLGGVSATFLRPWNRWQVLGQIPLPSFGFLSRERG